MNERLGIEPYRAMCLQLRCDNVTPAMDRTAARAVMQGNIDRLERQLPMAKAWAGPADCRLAVLPEFFLTGSPSGDIRVWADKASLAMDGPEYDRLGAIAQKSAVFLAGNVYEVDPNFEGWYFETSFIINPSGNVVLRYRRLNSLHSPTPHDAWDRYLDIYGLDAIFPVAHTEIGHLSALASEEIKFPEVARCMAMRGAQVILCNAARLTESATLELEICTRARAIENMAYVLTCNTGGYYGTHFPPNCVDGQSMIVGYQGHVLGKAGGGESITYADIDIDRLQRFRQRPGMENLLARQRFEMYAESYRTAGFHPSNVMLEREPTRDLFNQTHQETIQRLIGRGIL